MKCRQITDRKTITIEDAQFEIGMVPRYEWLQISSDLLEFNRLIKPITKQREAGTPINLEVPENQMMSPEYKKANEYLTGAYRALLRFGVKNHKGINDESDKPIPFIQDGDGFPAQAMIELYELNEIMLELALEILTYNTLSQALKKN